MPTDNPNTCTKGWSGRCARSRGKKCRCACGGHNHGTKQEPTDDTYNYEGYHRWPSKCGLRIYPPLPDREKTVVILSELNNNPGTSITNAIEGLATRVYREKLTGLDPDQIIFIEHYPERTFERTHYDLVSLKWTGGEYINPVWSRLRVSSHDEAVALYRLPKEEIAI